MALGARLLLLLLALPAAPFISLSAFLRRSSVSASRERLLARRAIGRFGLLYAILRQAAEPQPDTLPAHKETTL